MIELSVSLNFFGMGREFSTFVVKSCIVLARYFLRVGPRAVFMGVWRHFHEGSNFRILTLFGSGYAGLGALKMIRMIRPLRQADRGKPEFWQKGFQHRVDNHEWLSN